MRNEKMWDSGRERGGMIRGYGSGKWYRLGLIGRR
jgi:hypothetical protein